VIAARCLPLGLPLVLLVALAPLASSQELVGRAVLPAETFAEGPPAGSRLPNRLNGVGLPLASQPVQGFSAVVMNDDGTLLALADNGFGALENSADFRLRIYTLRPVYRAAEGGRGEVEVVSHVTLRDPDGKVPFAITEHFSQQRYLTGADFDVESLQRAPDGTLWLGDEFGPFLLHADASGKLLEAPIPLTDEAGAPIPSPQSPLFEESSAVRVLNALAWRARQRGAPPPGFSPWDLLLVDGNAASVVKSRAEPPGSSRLTPASSELFSVESLHAAGYRVVPYTVNDRGRMLELLRLGVDGLITDDPALLRGVLETFDADGDGKGGDLLLADGLVDRSRFDAQGHRGARNLRPENTLPAFEAALDALVTTLETDCGVTADGVAVLCHEPYVSAKTFRRRDGQLYGLINEVLIRELTLADLHDRFVGDVKQITRPQQTNDLALSPVAVEFAAQGGLASPYVMPSLAQLFSFVEYYAAYYAEGPGQAHPDAARRAKNAGLVRFNVETKLNPQRDTDVHGKVRAKRTVEPEVFARAVAGAILEAGLEARADVQSFDLRTLLVVQDEFPTLGTIWLAGDFPAGSGHGDGTNLQRRSDRDTPWLAGLPWPYRRTQDQAAWHVPRSGGFEGLALSHDGSRLLALLEKPLHEATERILQVHAFDLAAGRWSGERWTYPLDPRGVAIGAFQLYAPGRGVVIERDGTQGDLEGFKRVFAVTFPEGGGAVTKRQVLDLLDVRDPHGLAPPAEGDVGLGERFAFPFVTIECLAVLSPTRLLIVNDNNYPFSVGRHVGSSRPDDSELILVELAEPLP
jgi:glycerophosphoryl diester phosphodiesterase